MKKVMKYIITFTLDIFIILCKGYFCLLMLSSVINTLTTDAYALKLTACTLFILIVSSNIKDKIN